MEDLNIKVNLWPELLDDLNYLLSKSTWTIVWYLNSIAGQSGCKVTVWWTMFDWSNTQTYDDE